MSNNQQGLFPETPQICFRKYHAKLLGYLLQWGEEEQKKLIISLKVDKTTLSEAIGDLQALKWVCVDYSNFGNNIKLNNNKKKDINLFLTYWHSLSKRILIRPHSIVLKGLIFSEEEGRDRLVSLLSREEEFKYTPSYGMKNNMKHTFCTPYGKIVFHTKGNDFTFYIDGFVLPLEYSEIKHLEDYINKGIYERFLNLLDIIRVPLDKARVVVKEIYGIQDIDIGLIAKKDIHKAILMERILKQNKMFSDKSIYGVDELETRGDMETCIANVVNFLETCNLNKINLREGIEKDIECEETSQEPRPVNSTPFIPILNNENPASLSSPTTQENISYNQ